MFTAIENSVQTPAVVSVAQHASRTARPLRVVTNANLEARERLQSLGFAVQVLDAAALNGPSAANIDADIVVVDRSLAGTWVPFNSQKVNAPVVFINGLASPRADYGSDVIKAGHRCRLVAQRPETCRNLRRTRQGRPGRGRRDLRQPQAPQRAGLLERRRSRSHHR